MENKKLKICWVANDDVAVKFLLFSQLKFLIKEEYDVYAVCSNGKWIDDIKKEDVIPPDTSKTINKEKSAGAMTQVQFAYDMKGDLSIRYVDSADRLIYQVPSELMMRIKEAASKLDSSVNTNA